MKILHIINSLHFGGAEKLLLDTVPKYIQRGVETEILLLDDHKTPFYTDLTQKYYVKILANTKKRSVYNPLHILRIRRCIKNYDVIHVHLFPSLYWTALATLFLRHKTKLIVTEHNTENRRRNVPLLKYIDRYIYKKYDKIIAISEGVKENLQKHLGKHHPTISTINNGIDTKLFREANPYSKNALGIPEDAKIIVQVSSFTAQKDQDTLLKAISLVPEEVHLLLIGDGPLKEEKEQLTSTLKINHRVHFLGYRTDISQLLKTSDVSVLSSHYEGFGLAIVEGMASGNPCVGSDVPGLSKVIGEAGILFEQGNHIQLKEILQQLLSDEEYYIKIQKKCTNRAQQYDVSLMIDAYINLYNTL